MWIVNVGDSRAVKGAFSSGAQPGTWQATTLNTIHTPDDPIEKRRIELHGGRVTPPSKIDGPARIWFDETGPGLAMSRSIGDHACRRLGVIATPDVQKLTLSPEDKVLILGTDGLWEFVTPDAAMAIVSQHLDDATEASRALIRHATEKWNAMEGDYRDDITAIVAILPIVADRQLSSGTASRRRCSSKDSSVTTQVTKLMRKSSHLQDSAKTPPAQRWEETAKTPPAQRCEETAKIPPSQSAEGMRKMSRVSFRVPDEVEGDPKLRQAIEDARMLTQGSVVEGKKNSRSLSAPDRVKSKNNESSQHLFETQPEHSTRSSIEDAVAAASDAAKAVANAAAEAAKGVFSFEPVAASPDNGATMGMPNAPGLGGQLSQAQQKAKERRAKYKKFSSSPGRMAGPRLSSTGIASEVDRELDDIIGLMEQEKSISEMIKGREAMATDKWIENSMDIAYMQEAERVDASVRRNSNDPYAGQVERLLEVKYGLEKDALKANKEAIARRGHYKQQASRSRGFLSSPGWVG